MSPLENVAPMFAFISFFSSRKDTKEVEHLYFDMRKRNQSFCRPNEIWMKSKSSLEPSIYNL
jgi:hypothetical protein